MPTFDLATAVTVFFAICLFFCIVSYSNDFDDRGRGRPHRASSARYSSRTTKPAQRPRTPPLTGIITGQDLREQAKHRKHEMEKAREEADHARRVGNHSAAKMYNSDALAHRNAMKDLNKEAAKVTFKEKNKGLTEGTVDLHGLSVPEALEYAKRELQSATLRNDRVVCFIVGKGLHSEAGQVKIRPALEQLCDEHGYTHSLDPRNAGVLIVQC